MTEHDLLAAMTSTIPAMRRQGEYTLTEIVAARACSKDAARQLMEQMVKDGKAKVREGRAYNGAGRIITTRLYSLAVDNKRGVPRALRPVRVADSERGGRRKR